MALRMGRSLLNLRITEAGLNQREFSKRLGVSEQFFQQLLEISVFSRLNDLLTLLVSLIAKLRISMNSMKFLCPI